MRHILLASSLVLALGIGGCKDRTAPPKKEAISLSNSSFNTMTNTIITGEDQSKVTLMGDANSKLLIDGKEAGIFPESGMLEITLSSGETGTYTYQVQEVRLDGTLSKPVTIEIIKEKVHASLGSVSTEGDANALTVSQNGVIFIAEENHGVEIISIGFKDRVSSDLLSKIDTVDAKNVILSKDEKSLYVEDKEGQYHLIDISDLSYPVEVEVLDKIERSVAVETEDGNHLYRVSACGLIAEDVQDENDVKRDFLLKDKKIQDVVLVDDDKKLLMAHGQEGLQLFDLQDPTKPIMIASKVLGGNTSGLSLLKKDGILFVANGDKGVEIFDLEILLHQMTR